MTAESLRRLCYEGSHVYKSLSNEPLSNPFRIFLLIALVES